MAMRASAVSVLGLLLALPVLAGCIGTDGELGPSSLDDPLAGLEPGAGPIDETRLTQDVHDVLPKAVHYVEASLDGVRLYTEVHLPDGDGPWPTILELSPYHVLGGNGKLDALLGPGSGLVERYVAKGYAVVLAHVRGTGNSEGCMDMMGAKEQQDAHDVVEWVAGQTWSDGKVGMHGVSYVGTTPHEAAIMAPEHLTTLVTVAGVTNQWRNTFQNGVPYNGRHYPLTYEVLVGAPPPFDVERGPDWLLNVAAGACDQEEAIAHMSPGTYERGIYDDYWAERNLTTGAAKVKAPILYSQGFVDRAVNPSEAVHWFNQLDVPKKAFLHQAGHQYAPRDDYRLIEHAWFDHWLKGINNGVMDTPTVEVQTNVDTIRLADAWPPLDGGGVDEVRFHLAPGALVAEAPGDGEERYLADMARNAVADNWRRNIAWDPSGPGPDGDPTAAQGMPTVLTYASEALGEDLHLAGAARMTLRASADAENTYFLFHLYDIAPDGMATWLAEGWFNAHLREGFDTSAPLLPGETYTFRFKFEPREYVLQEGHRVGLVLAGHDGGVLPFDEPATVNTVQYGAHGTSLVLPTLNDPVVFDMPDGI